MTYDYKPLWCPYGNQYCVHRPYFGVDKDGNYKSPPNKVDINFLNTYGSQGAPCVRWNTNRCKDEDL